MYEIATQHVDILIINVKLAASILLYYSVGILDGLRKARKAANFVSS